MINNIPLVPENTVDPAAGLNQSITAIDALLQIAVAAVNVNTPPVSPADGTRVAIGTAPTGVFAGKANNIAMWTAVPGFWTYFATAHIAVNLTDGKLWVRGSGAWAAVN